MKCTGKVAIKENGRIKRDADAKPVTRPCKADAIKGGKVCHMHGGRAKQVRAKAAVRAEVMAWGLGDSTTDPGEVLLRLVSQSAARAQRYSIEIEKLADDHGGDLAKAMIGDSVVLDRDGSEVKAGEYIRGLVQLEAQERDRCAGFATKAIAAGLAERQVRLAEKQGDLIAKVLMAVFDELQLTEEQREVAPDVIRRQLRLIS